MKKYSHPAHSPQELPWSGGVFSSCLAAAVGLAFWLAPSTQTMAQAIIGNSATSEILGVGTASLIGGDLTDPENDGTEAAGPEDPSWNWVSISSNNEPSFDNGEASFNVFDNKLGGGNDKWCCDDATVDAPKNITVEFPDVVRLTHFTLSSANDVPGRDPQDWQIQGSNDGIEFTPIFSQSDDVTLWDARLQVVKITLDQPAPPYKFIRFECTRTADSLYQVGEIEYFGEFGLGVPKVEILGVGAASLLGGDLTDPENNGNEAGGPADPTWNWVGITASGKAFFNGGEGSFNIFDNKVGGGDDKMCCVDPTAAAPVWVAVQFANPVSLTHFTITSGNDTPGRDPTDFAIQGSDDGTTYVDIYHLTPDTNPTSPWTDRNQVVKFTLPAAAQPYRYIRYIAYATPADLHQLNEIEYFGKYGSSQLGFVSGVRNGINSFSFLFNDAGTSEVDASTVKLIIDGATATLGALSKVDGKIDVTFTPAKQFLPSSTHTYSISAKDNFGNNITSQGTFKTQAYALLTAADAVTPNPDMPGFNWNVHQNQAFTANDNIRPERQLAGLLGINLADPAAQSIATDVGVPGATENDPIHFEIPGTLSLSQAAGSNGAFPDDVMPGIPGTSGSTDGIAAEILYYVELPAGATRMIVNSDDGFRTTAGLLSDVFKAQFAGEFSGGRGAGDTEFTVYAETAGVYAFRTLWEEGGGGANIELVTIKEDGTKVLLNDVDNGGLRVYRAIVNASAPTVVSSVSPAPNAPRALPGSAIEVVITEGNNTITAGSIVLKLDNATVNATVTKNGNQTKVTFQPATPLAEGPHTATIAFTAGTARSDTWSFTVPRTTKDVVNGYVGLILGGAAYAPGHSGTVDDQAIEINRRAGSSVLVTDASFLNGPSAGNTMTFTFWQKLVAVVDQSVFWAVSPSSPSSSRGFQAHSPWSNNRVYFDTAGCCGAGDTRIDQDIATFPDYVDPTFWNQWHLFGFSKSGDHKEIWIDGKLFHQGENTAPLPTDFTELYIGADSANGNNFNGTVDDFAVYGSALTEADYAALLSGAKPPTLGAIAYWPFDGTPPVRPKLSVVRNANGTVTVTFEGDLYVSDTVNGTYVKLAGATSPLTFAPNQAAQFAKAIK